MPSTTAIVFTILAGIIALAAGWVYFFGIPPETKRAMEEKALETMGENKASYMMKDTISRVPATDQKEVQELRDSVGNAAGGLLQNPLGKQAGETADQLTGSFTGRSGQGDPVKDVTGKLGL
ncbi:hypothetical protein MBLNU457_5048t1 [Dothideomycetes sp. NU457]